MPSTNARPEQTDADRQSANWASKLGAIPAGDVEALAREARKSLAEGDFRTAFAFADRRCRLLVPSARDLLLRAQGHKACGRLTAAQRDLRAAAALDPTDAWLNRAALAWGDEESRREAAERLTAAAGSDAALRRAALTVLFEAGERLAHGLQRGPGGLSGWIAWTGAEPLQIEMRGDGEALSFVVEPDPDHPLRLADAAAADVAIETEAAGPLSLTLRAADGVERRVDPAWLTRPRARPPAPLARETTKDAAPFVTILAPVYEDFAATRACLESLAAARPPFDHAVVVVDDASPNRALKQWLDEGAARGDFELIRNETNLGFAAAVNKALALRTRGDALLLNADTLLPPGAVQRLSAISRSQADIGTLTPFSNNGELTSYPVRNEANPLPSPGEVEALDALAQKLNGEAVVDMPNGIGFCLYITESCLDAVGCLPEIYAQGYYEDVEFCLAARERGFRNVAAPGVYVGHAGSKSFAKRKPALVMRNLALIEARFPGYRLETAAFIALDPLKPYRAALDAALAPKGPVVVVACGSAAAAALGRRRAEALKAERPELTVLTLVASARGEAIAATAFGGGAPQSLTFDFDDGDADAFSAWLRELDVRRAEWLDPAGLPDAALTRLSALICEIDLLCGDLSWFSTPPAPRDGPCAAPQGAAPCEICRGVAASRQDDAPRQSLRRLKLARALERAERVVPLDRLAESFAQRVFKARAAGFAPDPAEPAARASRRAGAAIARLGALYPRRSPAVDRLLIDLARRLAAEEVEAELVVFGASLDDAALMATGKAFVTGQVAAKDYVELARDYGVEALVAPERGGGYGDLEAAAAAVQAPKAFFDWSFGAFAVESGDLSLDPRICDDKAARLIVDWMKGEGRT